MLILSSVVEHSLARALILSAPAANSPSTANSAAIIHRLLAGGWLVRISASGSNSGSNNGISWVVIIILLLREVNRTPWERRTGLRRWRTAVRRSPPVRAAHSVLRLRQAPSPWVPCR